MYSEKTIDHFSNPRNMGEIKNPDFFAQGGNPLCGDVVSLWIKIDNKNKGEKAKIGDIKFKAFGCGACIASSSALTVMIKGKTIEEAAKITNDDIVKFLGGLPPQKMICSNFSAEVFLKAVKPIIN